jgi:IS30 family transposase
VEHPASASVSSDQNADLNQQPGRPGGTGGHSQLATKAQGDLSHTRPSRARHSLTEGDIIFGTGRTTIATLAERHSRFVMLAALPGGHGAEPVTGALSAAIATLPAQLRRSLTWDQGKEMAEHARFSVATGVPVYFCDPHSPWQRGSNENTNGLLRQYFPRSTDFTAVTQSDLDRVAAELNDRPRQTLKWKSPCQALDEALR